jgi:hypothetical protein
LDVSLAEEVAAGVLIFEEIGLTFQGMDLGGGADLAFSLAGGGEGLAGIWEVVT